MLEFLFTTAPTHMIVIACILYAVAIGRVNYVVSIAYADVLRLSAADKSSLFKNSVVVALASAGAFGLILLIEGMTINYSIFYCIFGSVVLLVMPGSAIKRFNENSLKSAGRITVTDVVVIASLAFVPVAGHFVNDMNYYGFTFITAVTMVCIAYRIYLIKKQIRKTLG